MSCSLLTNLTHPHPKWGEHADSFLDVEVVEEERFTVERLDVRRMGDGRVEVCCIPLSIYEVAIGDSIDVSECDDGGARLVAVPRVVSRSEFLCFRVFLGDVKERDALNRFLGELSSLCPLIEPYNEKLIAVATLEGRETLALEQFLQRGEVNFGIIYEVSCGVRDLPTVRAWSHVVGETARVRLILDSEEIHRSGSRAESELLVATYLDPFFRIESQPLFSDRVHAGAIAQCVRRSDGWHFESVVE